MDGLFVSFSAIAITLIVVVDMHTNCRFRGDEERAVGHMTSTINNSDSKDRVKLNGEEPTNPISLFWGGQEKR